MPNPELERFKANIDLAELAASMGYQLDKNESSRSSLVMRHSDGDKIVVATGADRHGIFFSVKTTASGSVIDFVMYRHGVSLGHARKVLREYKSILFPTARRAAIRKPQPISHDRAALLGQWHRFMPCRPAYLESRGLKVATITEFSERIRSDERGNTVFRHDDLIGLSGWEKKNQNFTGFSAGGKKGFFACKTGIPPKAEPPRIVIAESAIDALSFYQLHPTPALYLSFGGEMSLDQHELLSHILKKYESAAVITAVDSDNAGDTFTELIRSLRPDAARIKPKGKDFNQDLCDLSQKERFQGGQTKN